MRILIFAAGLVVLLGVATVIIAAAVHRWRSRQGSDARRRQS